MTAKRKDEAAAIVTIRRPSEMTARGRKDIAAWLRRQARFLETHAHQMADRFTARYMY